MAKRLFESLFKILKCEINVKIEVAIKFDVFSLIKGGLATMKKFILWVWTGFTAGVSGVRSRLTK